MAETVVAENTETTQGQIAPNPYDEKNWKPVSQQEQLQQEPVVATTVETKEEPVKEEKPEVVAEKEVAKVEPKTEKVVESEPLKFANAESEKFFNLLKEGKEDEVFDYLSKKKTLDKIDKMDAADVIKLNMKWQNPEFTDQDVNDAFSDKFDIPEKPEYDEVEQTEEQYQKELVKWQKQVDKVTKAIAREGKLAAKELTSKREEIVLPDISKPQTETKLQPTQEELDAEKRVKELRESYLRDLPNGYKAFEGYNTEVKHEDNVIPVSFKIPEEAKAKLQSQLENFDAQAFLESQWTKPDGTFDTSKIYEDVYFLQNKKEVINGLAEQVANRILAAERKAVKNIDFSSQRNSSGQTVNAQEQLDNMAKHFYSN